MRAPRRTPKVFTAWYLAERAHVALAEDLLEHQETHELADVRNNRRFKAFRLLMRALEAQMRSEPFRRAVASTGIHDDSAPLKARLRLRHRYASEQLKDGRAVERLERFCEAEEGGEEEAEEVEEVDEVDNLFGPGAAEGASVVERYRPDRGAVFTDCGVYTSADRVGDGTDRVHEFELTLPERGVRLTLRAAAGANVDSEYLLRAQRTGQPDAPARDMRVRPDPKLAHAVMGFDEAAGPRRDHYMHVPTRDLAPRPTGKLSAGVQLPSAALEAFARLFDKVAGLGDLLSAGAYMSAEGGESERERREALQADGSAITGRRTVFTEGSVRMSGGSGRGAHYSVLRFVVSTAASRCACAALEYEAPWRATHPPETPTPTKPAASSARGVVVEVSVCGALKGPDSGGDCRGGDFACVKSDDACIMRRRPSHGRRRCAGWLRAELLCQHGDRTVHARLDKGLAPRQRQGLWGLVEQTLNMAADTRNLSAGDELKALDAYDADMKRLLAEYGMPSTSVLPSYSLPAHSMLTREYTQCYRCDQSGSIRGMCPNAQVGDRPTWAKIPDTHSALTLRWHAVK